MSLPTPQVQAIALNRFGLGVRPDEDPPADPRRWLLDQIDAFDAAPAAFAALPPPGSLARDYFEEVGELGRKPVEVPAPPMADEARARMEREARRQALNAEVRDAYRLAIDARLTNALTTPTPFGDRLTAFWSNHFALSADRPQVGIYAADFELKAIRPHVMGRFEDMLLAVEQHPAMLYYLDQYRSVGPDSMFGQRANQRRPDRKIGLNENLAREIMELHTLGVRTGYSQADVTEFAHALTGWSVGGLGPMAARDTADLGVFMFRPALHQPGDRKLMGKRYDQIGEAQARAIMRDLARSPDTARHVSTKLARHFAADDPPPTLVDRMSKAYLSSDGHLPAVYRAMIEAPEPWVIGEAKFKSPWDWTVSALRGLGRRDLGTLDSAPLLSQLGQPVWKPGSPAGYDDLSASWAAPDALMRRVELAQRLASTANSDLDARAIAPQLLPGQVTPATTAALAQAESGPTALALLLVSPEFQRR